MVLGSSQFAGYRQQGLNGIPNVVSLEAGHCNECHTSKGCIPCPCLH